VIHHIFLLCNNENQKTIEIVTSSGKSVRGTYNHPLLVKDGRKKATWVKLEDIKIGNNLLCMKKIDSNINKLFYIENDFLNSFKSYNKKFNENKMGPRYKGKIPKEVDEKLASIMGYVIGDGYVSDNKCVGFLVAEGEFDLEPILLGYFNDLFNLKPEITERKLSNGEIDGRTFIRTKVVRSITFHSKPLSAMLSFLKVTTVPK